jgi:glycosyltransferase involved in cell wall biosynthesis
MSDIPADVARLLEAREEARRTKDFARADELREEIAALGYDVHDTPTGATVTARPKYETIDPGRIDSILDKPATLEASIHLLYEGFLDDVQRFLSGMERHCADRDYEIVLLDNASSDGEALESFASERVRVVHLQTALPWAEARNAGLKTSRGRIVILADLSVEPTGDVLGPIEEALSDPDVGVAGPWGIVSQDMREFTASPGPEVDAVEGYFLATRRELLAKGLIHDKFRWYRHADIDLSFQLRALGTTALVVDIPAEKHTHRGWAAYAEEERAKRSKRNWNIFFDRWKHQHNMLLSHRDEPA